MFNKKTRRTFRQRKDESSDDGESIKGCDDLKESETCVQAFKQVNVVRRGISCSSKPNSTPPHREISADYNVTEDTEQINIYKSKENKKLSKSKTLSFPSHKEDADEDNFKLKRSVNKAVFFQARKKEDSPVKLILPQHSVKDVDLKGESESGSDEDLPPDSNDETNSTGSNSTSSSRTQTVIIPNAEKIRLAKEQRKRARAQRDYIPLDEDQERQPGFQDEEQDESSQEQGSNDELDDHERRIVFAPKPKTLREQMARKMGSSESEGISQEEEDHQLWEEEQLSKGVKRPQTHQVHIRPHRQKKVVHLPKTLPSVSVDIIKKRITGKLGALNEVHRARKAELRRMQLDMENAKTLLEKLENHPAEKQLHFFRTMNVFAQTLMDCLSEKMELINSVELDMHTLYIDQAEALLSKRSESVQKRFTYLQQLTYSAKQCSNGEDLGKTTAEDSELQQEDYGVVTDYLEPTAEQELELQSKRAEILKRSQEIFTDVQEDFSDVKNILSRFNEWRVSFSESYINAYISLCLPKLLAPLIRHQLIGWNPLKAEGDDFEELPWYSAVEQFCHGQGYEESENVDMKTLPAIIEKTILPKIQGFVELVWEPLSVHQSQSLTVLCKRIKEDYSVFGGEQSKPVMAFMEAVIQRLRSAVDNDVFIPLYPKVYLDDKTSQQFQFQNQQFWCAVKLLGNMALWDGLIAENILKELMLDKLLNRYLMMTLLNDSNPKYIIQKSKQVADCFPKSWFVDMSTGSTLPQLQHFSKHLLQTADMLCKESKDATSSRAVLSDVVMIIWNINECASVNFLAEKYNCQDLLQSLKRS